MENMEIERKFLVDHLPEGLETFPCHRIEQAYLCTSPVVRVRQEDETYYLTYKGGGLKCREEYNLPLNAQAYAHLSAKADGNILTKRRYMIPVGTYTAELDIFEEAYLGLRYVEVEFDSEAEADAFTPPAWFGAELTGQGEYQNSALSRAESPARWLALHGFKA